MTSLQWRAHWNHCSLSGCQTRANKFRLTAEKDITMMKIQIVIENPGDAAKKKAFGLRLMEALNVFDSGASLTIDDDASSAKSEDAVEVLR